MSEKISFEVKKKKAVLRSAGMSFQAEATADAKTLGRLNDGPSKMSTS